MMFTGDGVTGGDHSPSISMGEFEKGPWTSVLSGSPKWLCQPVITQTMKAHACNF